MEYKQTLLMGKSNFEMRGNLNQKEPVLVKAWQDFDLYNAMNLNRKEAKEFVLHDGPPYANGDMHCGHMLNRILKDFVVRLKNMEGYKTPFVFGWDTHGLPIENMVTKSGVNRKTTPIVEFRKKCEEYALKQVEKQKEQIRRLGLVGDFDKPYLTLQKEYEAAQIHNFATMALKGYIYKGLKPVYWSPSSETALAEAEIEYADVLSHSIYVAFPVKDGKGVIDNDARLVIWTTTPWTLPANLAISAHPDFIYGEYQTNKGKLVFLQEFLDNLKIELDLGDVTLIKEIRGQDLEGVVCKHPFYDRDSLVIVGTHVTNDAGTGLVHTAPGHGVEDYQVCLKYKGLEPYCPVDEKGFLMKGVGERLEGLYFEDANKVVLEILTENNALLKHTTFTHSYPHDWRTKKPLIFRATSQWFCSIDPIREALLAQIHNVKWYPSWGETRMVNMIKDRADWCISRQRAWGVPIPIFYAEDGTPIIEKAVFDHVENLFREFGSNIWYSKEAKELLPEGYTNPHSPNGKFTKENDIMDVWFDSGSSFAGALINRGTSFPSDLYLEGSDQYRGWFNSSLIVSTACYGTAPYKTVVSHGWVLDEHGEQMHKSKGNGVDPTKIANVYGADILRLWTATIDYQQDVRIGDNIIKQTSEQYRKIRNTLKFISWNLVDFDPSTLKVEWSSKQGEGYSNNYTYIDEMMLHKNANVYQEVKAKYDQFDFAGGLMILMNYIARDLSSFYLDIAKDSLYCDAKNATRRHQMQSVIYVIAETLLRLLNPILPFTMDEFNKNLPGSRKANAQLLNFDLKEFAHLMDENLNSDYENLLTLRSEVLKALEEARSKGEITSSQQAEVFIEVKDKFENSKYHALLDNLGLYPHLDNNGVLKEAIVVSEAHIYSGDYIAEGENYMDKEPYKSNKEAVLSNVQDGLDLEYSRIKVKHHQGHFCERCWNYEYDAVKQDDGTYLCKRCDKVIKENF